MPATTDDYQGLDLRALWRVLWRYKLLIVAFAIVAGGIATVLAFTAKPYFKAQVLVTEVRDAGMAGAASAIANQLGGLASLAGVNIGQNNEQGRDAQATLASRRLAEEFVRREKLIPAIQGKSKRPLTLWKAVERFKLDVVSVRQDRRNNVTTVTVEWTDAKTAAQWANGYVALANELLRTEARDDASRNIAYLNKQISGTDVVEMRRVMYNLIENETKTLMLANARQEYAFNVVDPAVAPEVKSRPKRRVMVLFGIVLGGFLGVVTALGWDAYRRSRNS